MFMSKICIWLLKKINEISEPNISFLNQTFLIYLQVNELMLHILTLMEMYREMSALISGR